MPAQNSRYPRLRRALLPLLLAAVAVSSAAADTFSMKGSVVAAGAGVRTGNACQRLAVTVGQALIGFGGSSANYSITDGFWRAYPPVEDGVFATGFESC